MLYRLIALAALLALAPGCGSSSAPTGGLDLGGADANQVGTLVDEVNEAKGDAKKIAAIFAKGSKPADPKKFAQCDYSLAGRPTVNGSDATCKVRVESSKGGAASEAEWSFVKEGDKWKIKAAPLP